MGNEVLRILGSSDKNPISKVRCLKNNKIYSMKKIDLNAIPNEQEKKLIEQQMEKLKSLNHPHLLKYYKTFKDEDQKNLYLIYEYMNNSDLNSLINVISVREAKELKKAKQNLKGNNKNTNKPKPKIQKFENNKLIKDKNEEINFEPKPKVIPNFEFSHQFDNINMPHYAELSIDLRIKSSPIMEDEPRRPKEDKEDYEERKFQWHCEYGIPENIYHFEYHNFYLLILLV